MKQNEEWAALIEELEAQRAEVARLSAERGAMAERERLAEEIHDTLAQGFTSIIMLIQAAETQADPARHLTLAVQTARENLAEARALVAALSSAPLDGSVLDEAHGDTGGPRRRIRLRSVCHRWVRPAGHADPGGAEGRLDARTELTEGDDADGRGDRVTVVKFRANPPSASQHVFMRLSGWELLYLVAFLTALFFVASDDALGTAERVTGIVLLSGCLVAYVRLGRRAVGVGYGSWEGRTYVALLIVLFTPVAAICPPTRFVLFALCSQCFMMIPKNQAKIAVIIFNVAPALEFLVDPPSLEELTVFLGVTITVLAFALTFGPWIVDIIGQSRERASLIQELEAKRAEVARLSAERGALAERERLAGEIHDTLAQGFTSIIMLLQQPDARRIELAVQTARENLAEARALITELSPAPLSGATLEEALGRITSQFGEELSVSAVFEVRGDSRATPTKVEVVLLRAAQEALANVRKHAQARAVAVTLEYTPETAGLTVRDDGAGFDPSATEGYGLRGMRARVEQVGGTLTLTSPPGGGTVLEAVVPTGQLDQGA
jgi:signal transduction histidine kinase